MASSFLDACLKALQEEEQRVALETGRGKHGTEPVTVAKHIGIAKGIDRAREIVLDTAKQFNTEDDIET